MIQVNELRVGNWVKIISATTVNELGKVYRRGKGMVEAVNGLELNVIHPIPLTTEILERCGFDRKSHGDNRHEWFSLQDFWLQLDWLHRDHFTYYPGWPELDCSGYTTNLNYFHQLQNLYFALTGEELNYQP